MYKRQIVNYSNSQRAGVILQLTVLLFGGYFLSLYCSDDLLCILWYPIYDITVWCSSNHQSFPNSAIDIFHLLNISIAHQRKLYSSRRCIKAVSYTHLDVYKRQGMTSDEVRDMSDEDLLDMDYFLHEFDDIDDDDFGEEGFYIF